MSNHQKSLHEALFGKIRRELLSVFVFNPGRSFYLLELVSILRTGRGGVQRELANLNRAGLLQRRKEGVKVLFTLSEECPVIVPLRELLKELADCAGMLEEMVSDICRDATLAAMSLTNSGIYRLLLVDHDESDELKSELERIKLLCGAEIRFELMTLKQARGVVAKKPAGHWVSEPSVTIIHGDASMLFPDEPVAVDENNNDLFSSAGLNW
jgi:hypothetical protein